MFLRTIISENSLCTLRKVSIKERTLRKDAPVTLLKSRSVIADFSGV